MADAALGIGLVLEIIARLRELHEAPATSLGIVRLVLVMLLYLLLLVFPLISGMAQAGLILVAMPFIVSYCLRWWPTVFARQRDLWTVNTGPDSRVALVVGTGTAMVLSSDVRKWTLFDSKNWTPV